MTAAIKLSDYVMRFLVERGVEHVFMLPGGGAMHLNDSLAKEKRLQFICHHHEQACAMAAEGYARVSGRTGVVSVTTGPGGINALNGVFGAWTDSIPMLVISGQVKRETCTAFQQVPGLRQLGDQEVDILGMARPITKYAAMVERPESIRYHLEKAWHTAAEPRGGPCWLDIPLDVQGAIIREDALAGYDPADQPPPWDLVALPALCREIVARLQKARRPVILVGSGVRLAGAVAIFERLLGKLRIPVTTGWTAHDLMDSRDPLYCGRPGTVGDRPGNFAVQNADLLLVLGCRLNIRQVGYTWDHFAARAYKIQVDADPAELAKPTVRPDLPVCCELSAFLAALEREVDTVGFDAARHREWLAWCKARVERYPVLLPKHASADRPLNPYAFVAQLFSALREDDVIVCGNGSACVVPFQAGALRRGQRMFSNSGSASMGYDLPAAIGAAFARHGQRVICLAGDGSLMMNLQELQTVAQHRLPIKLFVLNNNGYASMRQTQQGLFGRLIAESPQSGLTLPDFVRVGEAFDIPSLRIDRQASAEQWRAAIERPGPALCEVVLDPEQGFEPKSSSRVLEDGRIVSPPLEDMAPFLSREELAENILPT